ncbi:MAG: rimP [Marmoricola sp.]|nr:rimP [Marmoricola sp.]
MSTNDIRDRLVVLLTDPMSALGLDLEHVELSKAGKRSVLKVAVDQDGGVTMDDIADATREVSRVLDETDAMGAQPYTLEVSSRGVDKPLTLPRHWRRNVTRLVTVTPREGEPYDGRIVSSTDADATLTVDGAEQTVAFEDIKKARIQIEFTKWEG